MCIYAYDNSYGIHKLHFVKPLSYINTRRDPRVPKLSLTASNDFIGSTLLYEMIASLRNMDEDFSKSTVNVWKH